MSDDDKPAKASDDEAIVREAHKRFDLAMAWESDARRNFIEDVKFANGDSVNQFQWDRDDLLARQADGKPQLTVNKTRQHNLIIINDAKQNKPGVVIKANGGSASFEAAQVYEGIIRRIEYISNAEQAYDTATMFQVQGGIGYIRLATDYLDDDTFDQEIFVRRVRDPLSVLLDPGIKEVDGSDAGWGFIFDEMPKDEFCQLYPKHKDAIGGTPLDASGWVREGTVRIAEYFRKVRVADTLIAYENTETGETETVRESALPKELRDQFLAEATTRTRAIVTDRVEWFKIAGNQVVERGKWPGRYIPIARVIGEETVIDGKLDRKGHTRALRDAQRMYNFWTSEAALLVSLQSKTPYTAAIESISGFEKYWDEANVKNRAFLPFRAFSADGQPLPAPQRSAPPQMAAAYVQGMQIAQNEMMMASGQYQSQFGQNENATSGRAINERQRQGDTATYHFIDGLAIGVRFIGKMLIDLIPKIYDTPRVVKIISDQGDESEVEIDPTQPQALTDLTEPGEEKAKLIFNPRVGKYDVVSDIGPSYATQRQEAFNAFSQIVSQNNELMMVIGDLLFKNADFPGADEIAERIKRMIPPHIKGDGPPPDVQQLQQQTEQLQQMLAEMVEQLGQKQKQLDDKASDTEIKAFEAQTRRMGTVANAVKALDEKDEPERDEQAA